MRLFVFLAACTAATVAFADTTINTGISGGGAADLLNQTKPPAFVEGENKPRIQVTSGCETADGTKLSSGDAGYEACMRGAGKKDVGGKSGDSKVSVGVQGTSRSH